MITWLNQISPTWLMWMTAMLWQSAVLIAVVWVADMALRRFAWPQLRYALWLLVFVKLLLPPGFAMPTSLTSGIAPLVLQYLRGGTAATVPAVVPAATATDVAVPAAKHITVSANPLIPAAVHAVQPSISWQSGLMLIWAAGIVLLAIWLCVKLWRLRGSAEAVSLPEWFPQVLRQSADRVGLKHLPAVIVTKQVKCPAVLGALHPLILMPHDHLRSYTRDETANMLIHELAHIKRGDLVVHAVQLVLHIVYWPNVLLWLVRRPIHDLRELCCDATVAAALREETPAYRQTLLDTARILIAESADPGLGLLGLFERPHAIVTRLNYLEKPYGRQTMCKFVTVIALAAMFLLVLPMSMTKAESTTVENEDGSYTVSSSSGSSGDATVTTTTTTTTRGTQSVMVARTTGIAAKPAEQNIDANAIEFRVLWTAGKDLLPEEIEAIKGSASPLFINKECAWADLDPNVKAGADWVTRQGEDGITEILVSNRPDEILLPDGSWHIKSIAVNAYPGDKKPDMTLEFDTKGSSDIHDITSKNIGRPLAILVHGRVVSAPIVNTAIADKANITGNFTVAQLNTLMRSMTAAVPIKIEANVIVAPAATMERLFKQVGVDTSSATSSTGMRSVAVAGNTTGVTTSQMNGMGSFKLTDEMAASLFAALQTEPNARLIASPTILTFAEESAAIGMSGGTEDMTLKVTPHLQKKNLWVRLDINLTLSWIKNNAARDMKSVATVMSVPSGSFSIVSAGGTDKSMTYLLVKATPQK